MLGGAPVGSDPDLLIWLKTPREVADIAAALATLEEDSFRQRYRAIPPDDYGMVPNEGDLAYTAMALQQMQTFYVHAATTGESVLFVAYQ